MTTDLCQSWLGAGVLEMPRQLDGVGTARVSLAQVAALRSGLARRSDAYLCGAAYYAPAADAPLVPTAGWHNVSVALLYYPGSPLRHQRAQFKLYGLQSC